MDKELTLRKPTQKKKHRSRSYYTLIQVSTFIDMQDNSSCKRPLGSFSPNPAGKNSVRASYLLTDQLSFKHLLGGDSTNSPGNLFQ